MGLVMTSKATTQALNELHGLIAGEMAKKLRSGEATAAEWSVIRAFLRDNRIEGLAVPGSPMADLASSLPFAGASEDDEYTSH
jgi:hypothetical protein